MKIIWTTAILILLIAFYAVPTFSEGQNSIKPGDANGDGSVNIGDVTYVERVILGLSPLTPGCDANLDGRISIGDVTWIERIILGLA